MYVGTYVWYTCTNQQLGTCAPSVISQTGRRCVINPTGPVAYMGHTVIPLREVASWVDYCCSQENTCFILQGLSAKGKRHWWDNIIIIMDIYNDDLCSSSEPCSFSGPSWRSLSWGYDKLLSRWIPLQTWHPSICSCSAASLHFTSYDISTLLLCYANVLSIFLIFFCQFHISI